MIDGVFDSAAAGGVIFHTATGLDANAIVQVQAPGRRRLLRVFVRRSLPARYSYGFPSANKRVYRNRGNPVRPERARRNGP